MTLSNGVEMPQFVDEKEEDGPIVGFRPEKDVPVSPIWPWNPGYGGSIRPTCYRSHWSRLGELVPRGQKRRLFLTTTTKGFSWREEIATVQATNAGPTCVSPDEVNGRGGALHRWWWRTRWSRAIFPSSPSRPLAAW